MFPLTRSIRNPFTPNFESLINSTYANCLSAIEMSVPINLNPIITFFQQLGIHVKQSLQKRSQNIAAMKNTIDSVFVLYILSTGLIDDFQACVKTMSEAVWSSLPL